MITAMNKVFWLFWSKKQYLLTAKRHQLIRGALLGLKQFLATESPLIMIKTAFYFFFRS